MFLTDPATTESYTLARQDARAISFNSVQKRQMPATEELVAVILSAVDHMRALVDGDEAGLEAVGDEILGRLHH